MPFVRVSRDKRGYEHVYLFEVSSRRPSKPRILYWFRSPPGVRVGREPFDEPVRRALEAQNPDVTFDWKKLASSTVPPPDVENWRERRRAEREAKRARRAGEEEPADGGDPEPIGDAQTAELSAGEMPGDDFPAEAVATAGAAPEPSSRPVTASGAGDARPPGRHRRRRRGGRNRPSNRRPDAFPHVEAAPAGASLTMSSISDTTKMSDSAKTTADPSEEK